MDTLTTFLAEQPEWIGVLLMSLFTFLMSNSQVDAWAASNPRVAGLQKLYRSVNIDWVLFKQGWSLVRHGVFPASKKSIHPPPMPPSGPLSGGGVAVLAFLMLVPATNGCQQVKDVVFPVIAKCSPVPREILDETLKILKDDPGGTLTDRGLNLLEQLAKKYGPNAIACAVSHFAGLLSAPGDLEGNRVQSKAIDFQEKLRVRAEFEEPAAAPAPCEPVAAPAPSPASP